MVGVKRIARPSNSSSEFGRVNWGQVKPSEVSVFCCLQRLQLWIISHYLRFLTSPRARGIQHKGFVLFYSSEPSINFCFKKSLEPRPQTWLWFTPRSGFQSSPRFAVRTSWRKKKHRCVVALCAEDPWNVASIVEQKLLWRDKNIWCVQSLSKTLAHAQIFTVKSDWINLNNINKIFKYHEFT